MIALDEDMLICDLAQYYNIYQLYDYPVEFIATLSSGLPINSRIKAKELGLRVDVHTLLLAHICDNTAINVYAKTKDAKSGRNKPKSLVEAFTKTSEKKKTREFRTGADFDREWRRLGGN